MTRLVARLVLAMLILPATGALFIILMALLFSKSGPPSMGGVIMMWSVIYAFDGIYWILLWRDSVRWTARRIGLTIGSAPVAIMIGVIVAGIIPAFTKGMPLQIGALLAGGFPPILWVLAAVLIWRETPEERVERLSAGARDAVACPICGYNMTGLREAVCPECGTAFTLDRLLSSQPQRDAKTLPDE